MKPGQDSPDGGNSDIKPTVTSASSPASDEVNISEPLTDTALDDGAEENEKVTSLPPTSQSQLRSHSLDVGPNCAEYDLNSNQEMEELRLRVWSLETQLEVATSNRMSLQGLLRQVYLQEWSYLELGKRQAEEEVINAQKVVSVP